MNYEMVFRVWGHKRHDNDQLSTMNASCADEEEAKLLYGWLVEHGYRCRLEQEQIRTLRKNDQPE